MDKDNHVHSSSGGDGHIADSGGGQLTDSAARAFDVMAAVANPRQNRDAGDDALNHAELESPVDDVFFDFEGRHTGTATSDLGVRAIEAWLNLKRAVKNPI